MLQSSPVKQNFVPVRPVTGYALALSQAPAHARAFAAARLVLGHDQLVEPRTTQAARLACVSGVYATAAIALLEHGDQDLVNAVLEKRVPLLEAVVLARHPHPDLVEAFLAASANERLDLGRVAGVDMVFDTVISPLI